MKLWLSFSIIGRNVGPNISISVQRIETCPCVCITISAMLAGMQKETVERKPCVLDTGGQSEELRKPKKQLNSKHVSTALYEFKYQNT